MAFQKVEFEFPDTEDDKIDVEPSSAEKMNSSGDVEIEVEEEKPTKPEKAKAPVKEDDVEVEVVDDTPKADRGRKPMKEAPVDVTDDELAEYSERAQNRIKHFSKGYHEERRRKEEAERRSVELERATQQLLEENKKLKESTNKSQTALISQAKKNAETQLDAAKTAYKTAYDAGDSDAVLDANDKLSDAKIKLDKLNNLKVPALQGEETPVELSPEVSKPAPAPQVDKRTMEWKDNNSWFGVDDEMTSFALGLHNKLEKEGVNPQTEEYYERIDTRMRQVFPDNFEGTEEVEVAPEPKRQAQVVAPATRSTAPKKVTLTKTQVQIAKRLGLTPQQYAKQVAIDMRKQNG